MSTLAGEERGDVLLLKTPGRLLIYDQYQMTLDAGRQRALTPYAPLRILSHHRTLADGFTNTMLVSTESAQFYILKEENGSISPKSGPTVFTNVIFVTDTVRVLEAGKIALLTPDRVTKRMLAKGEVLYSQFEDRNQVYVRLARSQATFGWVVLPARDRERTWTRIRMRATASQQMEFPPSLVEGIRRRLDAANAVFDSLFARLNHQTGKRLTAPAWRFSSGDVEILCELEPFSWGETFPETTTMLAKEIETLLLGKGISLTAVPGRITIVPNGL